MNAKSVRFGLVGFGAWGKHHANAINKTDGAELVAVATRTEDSAEQARGIYPRVSVTTDFRELIHRDDLDIVDVVIPSHLHHEVATEVLNVDKHLLLEKPMGVTVTECDDLIRIAGERDR